MPEQETVMENTGVSRQHRVEKELQRQSSENLNDIDLPFTIENVTLMSPGTWNNKEYRLSEIRNAAQRTDFDDAEVKSLFNEHDDEDSRDWIGEVQNIRMDGEELVGDLQIVTADEARKLAYGARFGISPKVTGRDRADVMEDFRYDNFSLVLDPAVKTTYINSEDDKTEDDEDAGVKNVKVKSTMSEQDNKEELSQEQQEQLSELVSKAGTDADVEDLAEIASPFMGKDSEQLESHIEDMVEEENAYHGDDEDDEEMRDIEEIARRVVEEIEERNSGEDLGTHEDEEDEEDEETMSVDEIADEVASRVKKEMADEGDDESEDEEDEETMSVEDVVSEVKEDIKEELESVKEELSAKSEEENKTPNPGSEATGDEGNSVEEELSDMEVEDKDKAMAKRLLSAQKGGLR